jgi:hypothetical protein
LCDLGAWTELDQVGLDVENRRRIDRVQSSDRDRKTIYGHQFTRGHTEPVGTSLGALRKDPHQRPVLMIPRVSSAEADLRFVNLVEDEHDIDVGEVGQPRKNLRIELFSIERDGAHDVAAIVIEWFRAGAFNRANGGECVGGGHR